MRKLVCKILRLIFVFLIFVFSEAFFMFLDLHPALRVQIPNNCILTQNLYYSYYHPKPK